MHIVGEVLHYTKKCFRYKHTYTNIITTTTTTRRNIHVTHKKYADNKSDQFNTRFSQTIHNLPTICYIDRKQQGQRVLWTSGKLYY